MGNVKCGMWNVECGMWNVGSLRSDCIIGKEENLYFLNI